MIPDEEYDRLPVITEVYCPVCFIQARLWRGLHVIKHVVGCRLNEAERLATGNGHKDVT